MPGSPIKRKRIENWVAFLTMHPDAIDQICDHIQASGNLVTFCRHFDLHYGSLSDWIQQDDERAKRYRAALDTRDAYQHEHVSAALMRFSEIDLTLAYDENGRPLPFKDIPEEVRACIVEIVDTPNGRQIKFVDKMRATEVLGKRLKMFVDKVEHSADETLSELIAKASKL